MTDLDGRFIGITADCPLAEALAQRLRAARNDLVTRWLERIAARVELHPHRIFPSEDLLDHVPLLIESLADYLEDPAEEISADAPLVAKAMELGTMRHEQGFEVYEILKEYELLGGIVFSFLTRIVDDIDRPCSLSQMLACSHRLFRGIAIIQEVTTVQFMRLAQIRVAEREERLRGFNRALSHEVRNRLGALRGAVEMLNEEFVRADEKARHRFHSMAVQNVEGIERTINNLIELSRMESDARGHRNVLLAEAVFEVTRQLRYFAESGRVHLRIDEGLPRVEVPASAVELALTNYLSNAIKYRDPGKERSWVEVRGWMESNPRTGVREVVVAVADNGLGVPSEAREHLFDRYFRAHAESAAGVQGTGLGLSLVRETIEGLDGRVWVDVGEAGETIFAFALPGRRATDRAGAARDAE